MTKTDALACRRALREIREIAAVALLDGALMTEQDALHSIAAIAEWVVADRPDADCGDLVRRLDAIVGPVDIDQLDDREAVDLFHSIDLMLRSEGRPVREGSPN
jgi:hypothetical protein